jgi:predicted nucleic acid-binding protein
MKKEPAVSNTSALLFLSKLDNIVFLKNIFSKILIPTAVFDEISSKKDPFYSNVNDLIDEKFIEVIDIKNMLLARHLSHNLHSGESEAIVLAIEYNYRVILDDGKAREIALSSGLKIIGTLGILKLLKILGHINETDDELFSRLKKIKFRIHKDQYFDIMRSP